MIVNRNEHDQAVGGPVKRLILEIACPHIDGNMHAGPPRIDNLRLDFDETSDQDRLVETNSTNVHRHAVVAAPPHRTGIAGLVDPSHHAPAMHLTAEIDVDRLREEAQSHVTSLGLHHDWARSRIVL